MAANRPSAAAGPAARGAPLSGHEVPKPVTAYGRSKLAAEEVVKAILADIDAHAADQAQGDDMTIVAMRIEERRAKRKTTTIPGVAIAELANDGTSPAEGGGEPEPS